jgi:cysteine desulfurase
MTAAPIYLDHNSTTSIDPRVVEAMVRAWRDVGANPASQHGPGRKARRMLEDAREGIAELLGAKTGGMDADQLIFTSGGTEANNLALVGLTTILAGTKPGPGEQREKPAILCISPIEHPSITAAVAELRRRGCEVRMLPVNSNGLVHIGGQECLPHVVSVMLANNETGVIQPVADIAKEFRERGALIHSDAVQAVGKIPVNFAALGVDAMTAAPHKFHGPVGIGVLVVRHGIKLGPQLVGGFQQAGIRPGTENVALAVGFHKALELAMCELDERVGRMLGLRDALEELLSGELQDIVVISKDADRRLPNTSCVAFPGLDRQALVMALDLAGVACSTGSACASGSSDPSPTLVAMGLPKPVIDGAIRLSLGAFTTAEEVAEAARRIIKTVKHLRSGK